MFYYHTQEYLLEKKSKFSAGYDLHAIDDYDLEYGRPILISTGIRLVLPWQQCREAQIRVRSSVGMNGIIVCNSPGTIDCIPAGTEVKTPEEDIDVKELFESFSQGKANSIISYWEEGNCFRDNSLDFITKVPGKNLVTLELESNKKVTLPETKEVFTRRGWIKVKDLVDSDEILHN